MQSGVSLYLAITVLIILLAIVLGLTAILVSQIQMVREMGYSVIALSAADTGIEAVLVDWGTPDLTPGHYNGFLGNGATYEVFVTPAGGSCTALNYCIKSVGTYPSSEGVRRAIEITY